MEHVSLETVCSGVGLPNVYAFLRDSGRFEEPGWLKERLAAADDMTPVIVEAALDPSAPSEICLQAVQIFVDVLAASVSNLALMMGAMGGVFIGGGIPPRILPLLLQERFLKRYLNKAGYEDYLQRVPVKVILNTNAALLGAADYGLKRIEELV
jgi:glucokinase